jgi:hypothetical protein
MMLLLVLLLLVHLWHVAVLVEVTVGSVDVNLGCCC